MALQIPIRVVQALSDRHAVLLADTVSANPDAFAGVAVLDLSHNGIGDGGLAALDVVLHGRALPRLAELALAHNSLSAPSASRIAAALLRTARGLAGSLRRLCISGNPLGCVKRYFDMHFDPPCSCKAATHMCTGAVTAPDIQSPMFSKI